MDKEVRSLQQSESLKVLSDADLKVSGYALKFDTISQDLGGFYETIPAGTINESHLSDVRLLLNHDRSQVLARTKSGTMNVKLDEVGLYFEARLPNTPQGTAVYESLKRGDLDGCSFEMGVIEDSWSKDPVTGAYIRTIKQIDEIREISIETFPAYADTEIKLEVAQRSLNKYRDYEKDLLLLQIEMELASMEEP